MNIKVDPSLGLENFATEIVDAAEKYGFSKMDANVTFLPANRKREAYEKKLNGTYPGDNAFRAFCDFSNGKPEIFIFRDEAETEQSLYWLFIHELTHVALRDAPLIHNYVGWLREEWLDSLGIDKHEWARSPELRTRDDLHEADPEERYCNTVATTYAGGDFSRPWWRERRRRIGLDKAA